MTNPDPNGAVPSGYEAAPTPPSDLYPPQQYGQPPLYGQPQYPSPQYPPQYPPQQFGTPARSNSLAMTSLILGIAAMVCVGILAGVPAIITGVMARRQIAASHGAQSGDSQALWGIILGSVATVLTIIVFLILIAAAVTAPVPTYQYTQ